MSRLSSHIRTAAQIIHSYQGQQPFSLFIKDFFAKDKKYGSRDRRSISTLCYNYFRLGNSLHDLDIQKKILAGLFLCTNEKITDLEALSTEWYNNIGHPIKEKLTMAKIDVSDIFPFTDELPSGLQNDRFFTSFLSQPHLFIRIRPGKATIVEKKLEEASITFQKTGKDCIEMANGVKAGEFIELDRDAVIQDLNSQKVLDPLVMNSTQLELPVKSWDCCAASGGKAILLYDRLEGKVKLTLTDIRKSILVNLEKRLKDAGIDNYESMIADLEKEVPEGIVDKFQVIICDVPCSGSGTWGRTPEQLTYFKKEKIAEYVLRQKRILTNVMPFLAKGGLLFYITCSVFKKENEQVAEYIRERSGFEMLRQEYLEGYESFADTMFVAVFKNDSIGG
jgi:16S rRNA (cytosine967-C5)-methyltransferase